MSTIVQMQSAAAAADAPATPLALGVDTDADSRFERIARIAQHLLGVECVVIRLLDGDRVWPSLLDSARFGFDAATYDSVRAILAALTEPLIVEDVHLAPEYAGLRTTVRFFAAVPIAGSDGRLGTLVALGLQPKKVTDEVHGILAELATWVQAEMHLVSDHARGHAVQQGLFPRTMVSLERFDVAGLSRPMDAVGGDFYDWYPVRGGAAFTLGDVMGKGISAALIGATVRATMRSSSRVDGPAAAVESAADAVAGDLEGAGVFVTLFHGHLNESTGVMRYIDAGHGLSLVVHANGGSERLTSTGVPLGAGWEDEWEEKSAILAPGDVFVSVSDGVLDAWGGTLDALDRVETIVRRSSSAQEIVDAVAAASVPNAPDDVTVVAVVRDRD